LEHQAKRTVTGPLERIGPIGLVLLAPAALIFLSFNAGGFFPTATGIVAIVLVQALVLRATLAKRPFEGFGRALAIPLIALILYAAWTLISVSWAHATASVLDSYDRVLLYVLALVLFGSISYTRARVGWLLRVMVAGMAAVCLIGLISRVLPHTWPTASTFFADRLNYPLTYWNAEGMVAALVLILGFHLSADRAEHPVVRVLAAAVLPGVAATLLLTFSRGSFGVVIIGLLAYCLLARLSTLPTALLAIGPPVAVALHSAWDATALASTHPTSPQAISQGHYVALVVGACMLAAGLLRALGLLADSQIAKLGVVRNPPSRTLRVSVGVGCGVVAIVLALALGLGGFTHREYEKFVNRNAEAHVSQTRERLSDPTNNGRLSLWKAAVHIYDTQKLHGTGAGTYQQRYPAFRSESLYVSDAHSLYLQSLSELGIVGFALIVVVVGAILIGLAARIRGPDRGLYAALLAAMLAWSIHQAFDWDWQMPALTLTVFILAGAALARPASASPGGRGLPVRRTLVALGLLLVAVCPLLVSVSYARVADSEQALTHGNCPSVKRHALASLSYSAERPQAYALIGVCDLKDGFGAGGVNAMAKAVSYEPASWEYTYLLALARAAAGMNPHATLLRAARLNPRESMIEDAVFELASDNPESWEAAAPLLLNHALASGKFSIAIT
jgi:O-Antigen ligase